MWTQLQSLFIYSRPPTQVVDSWAVSFLFFYFCFYSIFNASIKLSVTAVCKDPETEKGERRRKQQQLSKVGCPSGKRELILQTNVGFGTIDNYFPPHIPGNNGYSASVSGVKKPLIEELYKSKNRAFQQATSPQ